MSSSEEVVRKLDALWHRYLPTMISRLSTIRNAIENLEAGHLDEELRIEAAREAHKLAGSLGTFGLAASSEDSSRIETLLSQSNPPDKAQELRNLVESLNQAILNR